MISSAQGSISPVVGSRQPSRSIPTIGGSPDAASRSAARTSPMPVAATLPRAFSHSARVFQVDGLVGSAGGGFVAFGRGVPGRGLGGSGGQAVGPLGALPAALVEPQDEAGAPLLELLP